MMQKSIVLDLLARMPLTQQYRLIKIIGSNLVKPFLTLTIPQKHEVEMGNPNVNELIAVA
jgi:hypothetical protein